MLNSIKSMVKSVCLVFFSLNHMFVSARDLRTETLSEQRHFRKDYNQFLESATKQKSFSAHFSQELYSFMRDKILYSHGILTVKKPSSFLFKVISPQAEVYVSNGVEFWKYLPDLNHVQKFNINSVDFDFIKILTNLNHLKDYYEVLPWTLNDQEQEETNIPTVKSSAPPAQSNKNIFLKFIPRADKKQKILYAVIQLKTGFIQELRLVQLNGNRLRLVFSQYSDKPVQDSIFNFTPPEGVVIDKM